MSGYFPASASRFAILLLALLVGACNYSFTGGGGFPSRIRTLYIAPIENDTRQFDLDQQVARQLSDRLPRAFGVRLAGERVADAILRARITRYEDVAQSRPAQPGQVETIQNQIQITMTIEVIDVVENVILFESTGISGRGEYRPDVSTDEAARARAIELLIQQIIDNAQSQW